MDPINESSSTVAEQSITSFGDQEEKNQLRKIKDMRGLLPSNQNEDDVLLMNGVEEDEFGEPEERERDQERVKTNWYDSDESFDNMDSQQREDLQGNPEERQEELSETTASATGSEDPRQSQLKRLAESGTSFRARCPPFKKSATTTKQSRKPSETPINQRGASKLFTIGEDSEMPEPNVGKSARKSGKGVQRELSVRKWGQPPVL